MPVKITCGDLTVSAEGQSLRFCREFPDDSPDYFYLNEEEFEVILKNKNEIREELNFASIEAKKKRIADLESTIENAQKELAALSAQR